mgnify:CR=1 FL=1
MKVKCEVEGSPPATKFHWFKNEAPLKEEPGRVKVKDSLKGTESQWSILRFRELESLDTGFYRCEASNAQTTIKSEAVIKVNLGSGRRRGGNNGRLDLDDEAHVRAARCSSLAGGHGAPHAQSPGICGDVGASLTV